MPIYLYVYIFLLLDTGGVDTGLDHHAKKTQHHRGDSKHGPKRVPAPHTCPYGAYVMSNATVQSQ